MLSEGPRAPCDRNGWRDPYCRHPEPKADETERGSIRCDRCATSFSADQIDLESDKDFCSGCADAVGDPPVSRELEEFDLARSVLKRVREELPELIRRELRGGLELQESTPQTPPSDFLRSDGALAELQKALLTIEDGPLDPSEGDIYLGAGGILMRSADAWVELTAVDPGFPKRKPKRPKAAARP